MRNFKTVLPVALVLVLLLTFTFPAIAETKTDVHSVSTDASGAKIIVDKSTKTTVDSAGAIVTEKVTESTHDPKGLGNKTKVVAHTESKSLPNGDREDREKSVDSDGTVRDYSAEVKIKENDEGGATTVIESTEIVDPKGLLNKQFAETKTEIKTDAEGSVVGSTVTKKVNGTPIPDIK